MVHEIFLTIWLHSCIILTIQKQGILIPLQKSIVVVFDIFGWLCCLTIIARPSHIQSTGQYRRIQRVVLLVDMISELLSFIRKLWRIPKELKMDLTHMLTGILQIMLCLLSLIHCLILYFRNFTIIILFTSCIFFIYSVSGTYRESFF